jgi:exodeoxyribonuclease III
MPLTIATWNINSVRLRIGLVRRFLEEHRPDVLCLQETKCPDANFPHAAFREAGYRHIEIHGQKGYHGVALVSRLPLTSVEKRTFCGKADARHIAASLDHAGRQVTIHNLYIPAGGDEPDPEINPKFAHKLSFLEELHSCVAALAAPGSILVGDLNIAPLEMDVWSHRQLLKVVSHTPVETEALERVREAGRWVDLMRRFVPPELRLYTWWSYRSLKWEASDRGRRLDHIWATSDLAPHATDMSVLKAARSWERPSDHVPVIATFA